MVNKKIEKSFQGGNIYSVSNKYNVRGVSFSGNEELLAHAKARAKEQGRSLSNYIVQLIRADISNLEPLILKEPNSAKIQSIADNIENEVRYTIRRRRKPTS